MCFGLSNETMSFLADFRSIGFIAEKDLSFGGVFKRQMFSTHRSLETHIYDRFGKEVLRVR